MSRSKRIQIKNPDEIAACPLGIPYPQAQVPSGLGCRINILSIPSFKTPIPQMRRQDRRLNVVLLKKKCAEKMTNNTYGNHEKGASVNDNKLSSGTHAKKSAAGKPRHLAIDEVVSEKEEVKVVVMADKTDVVSSAMIINLDIKIFGGMISKFILLLN